MSITWSLTGARSVDAVQQCLVSAQAQPDAAREAMQTGYRTPLLTAKEAHVMFAGRAVQRAHVR